MGVLVSIFGLMYFESRKSGDVITVHLLIGEDDLYTMPEVYLAHSMDSSIIAKKEWERKDFNDERVKHAVKLISPFHIRFGGVMSDHTIFEKERPGNFR